MSMSCGVKGVLLIHNEFVAELLSIKQQVDNDQLDEDLLAYLFGLSNELDVETRLGIDESTVDFTQFDANTGILTFVTGFSAYDLNSFIQRILPLCKSYLIYTASEGYDCFDRINFYTKHPTELSAFYKDFLKYGVDENTMNVDGRYSFIEQSSVAASSIFEKEFPQHVWVLEANEPEIGA